MSTRLSCLPIGPIPPPRPHLHPHYFWCMYQSQTLENPTACFASSYSWTAKYCLRRPPWQKRSLVSAQFLGLLGNPSNFSNSWLPTHSISSWAVPVILSLNYLHSYITSLPMFIGKMEFNLKRTFSTLLLAKLVLGLFVFWGLFLFVCLFASFSTVYFGGLKGPPLFLRQTYQHSLVDFRIISFLPSSALW